MWDTITLEPEGMTGKRRGDNTIMRQDDLRWSNITRKQETKLKHIVSSSLSVGLAQHSDDLCSSQLKYLKTAKSRALVTTQKLQASKCLSALINTLSFNKHMEVSPLMYCWHQKFTGCGTYGKKLCTTPRHASWDFELQSALTCAANTKLFWQA